MNKPARALPRTQPESRAPGPSWAGSPVAVTWPLSGAVRVGRPPLARYLPAAGSARAVPASRASTRHARPAAPSPRGPVACGRVPGITLKTAVVPAEFTCAGCGRSRAVFPCGAHPQPARSRDGRHPPPANLSAVPARKPGRRRLPAHPSPAPPPAAVKHMPEILRVPPRNTREVSPRPNSCYQARPITRQGQGSVIYQRN